MAKLCKDFFYEGRSLSDAGFTTVDFQNNDEISLFLQRELTKGETNYYRQRANHIGASLSDNIQLEFHIVKSGYDHNLQGDLIFSRDDIREVTRWLTSSDRPLPLKAISPDNSAACYCGVFTNIETLVVGGQVYGLILSFTNDSPYVYSEEITQTISIQGYTPALVKNRSDLLDDYLYPVIRLEPGAQSDFILCNRSDCRLLEEGGLAIESAPAATLEKLLGQIAEYAAKHQYTTEFYYDHEYKFRTLADDTAIRFKYIEDSHLEHHCLALWQPGGTYLILEGGFFTCKLRADLPITINCELLTITDDLDRMILFSELGMADEDYIYWPRLKSGTNTFLLCAGDCSLHITSREMQKAGGL